MELLGIDLLGSAITIASVVTRYEVTRYRILGMKLLGSAITVAGAVTRRKVSRYEITRYEIISQRNHYSWRSY